MQTPCFYSVDYCDGLICQLLCFASNKTIPKDVRPQMAQMASPQMASQMAFGFI